MTRRSLRPQLNQIRGWVRQGRTDAWIAHQLEVTVQQIQTFKRENELAPDGDNGSAEHEPDVDLRAEDDARIAEELERADAERAEAEAAAEAERAEAAATRAASGEDEDEDDEDDEDEDAPPRPRRARRGGRGRRRAAGPLEGTFDHGDEGYGLWLDPAVQEDPVYAEHWAGHRTVEVVVAEDTITIRRSGESDADDDA